MKKDASPLSWHKTGPIIAIAAIAVSLLGLLAFVFVDLPPSMSMPLGTLTWSLFAALFITFASHLIRRAVKEAEGGIRAALLPAALLLAAFASMPILLTIKFTTSSDAYLALGLSVPILALMGVSFRLSQRASRAGMKAARIGYFWAGWMMSLNVLFTAYQYFTQTVSSALGYRILWMGLIAAVQFGFFRMVNQKSRIEGAASQKAASS